jgi:nicotinamide-nucleotide amidase
VEEKIYPVMKNLNIPYTILAHPQMIEILITSDCQPVVLKKVESFLKKEFGENYLGENPFSIPEILGRILIEKRLNLSIAESCTGGLASKLMTDIPGSSEYFIGSVIAYNNTIKKKVLKIPKPLIKKYRAVSSETALAMAKKIKKICKTDVSLSFTGIAGPSGGTEEKPVGLVFIGLGLPNNKYTSYRFVFSGNRERIREQAVYKGLDLTIKNIKRLYEENR